MESVQEVCDWLLENSNAISVALLDLDRRQLCRAGEPLPESSLPVIDKESTAAWFERDQGISLHASPVGQTTLYVLFDLRTSLGLVRLRMKKASEELRRILSQGSGGGSPAPAEARVGK